MHCGIYVITERATGKMYVGLSEGIEKRWADHSVRKFPKKHFTYEILHPCPAGTTREELSALEKFYIKELDCMIPNGFNKTSGGTTGSKVCEETKLKKSKSMMGKNTGPRSPETIKKISDSLKGHTPHNKGVPCSEEQKKKQSEIMKGRTPGNKGIPHSEETKRKISEAAKRRAANKRLQEGLNGQN